MTELVKLRARSSSEKRRPNFFWLLAVTVVPLWSLLTKYRFTPESRLPESGPFILAPNHMSEIDPIAVGVAVWRLGRLPRFMAKASLFRVPFLGWVMRSGGHIPVERNNRSHDNKARKSEKGASGSPLDAAAQLISQQSGVIVYPEGTLTRDPNLWPMRGKSGAARLALESGIPLYPAAHWGVEQIMPRYSGKIKLWGRKKIAVAIGKPLDLSAYRDKPITKDILDEVTAKLIDEITKLLEKLRGDKAPLTRWDPKQHNQSETGRF